MTGGAGDVATQSVKHNAMRRYHTDLFSRTVQGKQLPHLISTIMAIILILIDVVFVVSRGIVAWWSGERDDSRGRVLPMQWS